MPDGTGPAVVLFIYNRPDVTARVFAAIRQAQPRRLFVFADGPHGDRLEDRTRISAAQAATADVDWACDVHRGYADTHLGIQARMESGLDRVFDEVETAIILEDDCLPDPSFFRFAADLLNRYEDDARVVSVCGSRLTPRLPGPQSYGFSRYQFLWGWATWRRAWRRYEGRMHAWPRLRETTWLNDCLRDRHAVAYWTYIFDATWQAAGAGDWDAAWMFSSWRDRGIAVVPAHNLVTNLGFDDAATHTRDGRHRFAALPSAPMAFPLNHPGAIAASADEDALAATHVFSGNLARLMTEVRRRVHAAR